MANKMHFISDEVYVLKPRKIQISSYCCYVSRFTRIPKTGATHLHAHLELSDKGCVFISSCL